MESLSPLPEALAIDLDGTIVDSALSITSALNKLIEARRGPPVRLEIVAEWISLGVVEMVGNALGPVVTSSSDDVALFRAIYRAQKIEPAHLYPNAAKVLAAISRSGIKIGICTNKPQDLAVRLIEGLGIAPYVDVIVGGSEDLPPKPSAAPVLLTLDRMKTIPALAVFVGDSEIDASAAEAAGMPFILVNFGYAIGDRKKIRCVAAVDSLIDLLPLLGVG